MNVILTIVFLLVLAACSSPAATDGQASIKGYGVAAVAGNDLSAMLARCPRSGSQATVAERSTPLDAECNQLLRTMHNQPGNSVKPDAIP